MLILQQNLKNKYQTIDNDTLKFRAGQRKKEKEKTGGRLYRIFTVSCTFPFVKEVLFEKIKITCVTRKKSRFKKLCL